MLDAKLSLAPVIQSKGGLHYSLYIKDNKNIIEKVESTLAVTERILKNAWGVKKISKFMRPLYDFIYQSDVLDQMEGQLGFFKNESSLRVLKIPTQLESLHVLSSTYHVKPLLKWLQFLNKFYWIDVQKNKAVLLIGDQYTVSKKGTLYFESEVEFSEKVVNWLSDMRSSLGAFQGHNVFVTGENTRALFITDMLKMYSIFGKNVKLMSHSLSYEVNKQSVLNYVKEKSNKKFEKVLLEFEKDQKFAVSKLDEVAIHAVKGRITKLLISEDIRIFGHLNEKNGKIKVNSHQKNHEDDDLLDDIAQLVLENGGEVLLAEQNKIPGNKIIQAFVG